MGVDAVVAALQDLRLHPVRAEAMVHEAMATCLRARGIGFEREVRIGPRCRVDFLCEGGVAIEVKRGKPNGGRVGAQVARYCACEAVQALVLVTERSLPFLVLEERGKPVRVVVLVENWGIAL
jgi:hypothetical protein